MSPSWRPAPAPPVSHSWRSARFIKVPVASSAVVRRGCSLQLEAVGKNISVTVVSLFIYFFLSREGLVLYFIYLLFRTDYDHHHNFHHHPLPYIRKATDMNIFR